jgi:hypothetical protein
MKSNRGSRPRHATTFAEATARQEGSGVIGYVDITDREQPEIFRGPLRQLAEKLLNRAR